MHSEPATNWSSANCGTMAARHHGPHSVRIVSRKRIIEVARSSYRQRRGWCPAILRVFAGLFCRRPDLYTQIAAIATMRNASSRSCERVPVRCWLTILASSRKILARAVNISGSGAMIRSLFPIVPGSFVKVRGRRVELLGGDAYVRYCERQGWTYVIGVEFARPFNKRF